MAFFSQLLSVVKELNGSQILVAKVANQKIRVYGMVLSVAAAANAKLSSDATVKMGRTYMGINGNWVLDIRFGSQGDVIPWVECGTNEDLNLVLSAAVDFGATIWYTQG